MALELSVHERIAAPPERVFAAASNFAGAPERISGILRVEVLTDGPVGVGTRFRETRKLFGKEATEEMTVAEFDPPRRYVLLAENQGCRYTSELRFDPEAAGTLVTMTFRAQPLTLFARIMSTLMRPMAKAMVKLCAKDLADLKRSLQA